MTILVEFFCREMWRQLGDADGDGCITEEEIGALFDECDADKSGSIDADELTACLATRLGEGASRLVAKQMISLADTDESGTLSRDEITGIMAQLSQTMRW